MDLETRALLTAAKAGDKAAAQSVALKNLPLVKSIARRFTGRGTDFEDLCQIGSIGLVKAVYKFDFKFETEFSTYAVALIMGEIKRFLRDDGLIKVSRSTKELAARARAAAHQLAQTAGREPGMGEIAGELGVSREELAAAMEATAPPKSIYYDAGANGEQSPAERPIAGASVEDVVVRSVALTRAMDSLAERERRIIQLRYYKEKTQTEVAKIVGLSQVQVSRIEKKLLLKLRETLV